GVLEGAERRVDRAVVAHVVPAVGQGRGVPGGVPDRVHAEVAQVAEPRADAGEVAGAVTVPVGEAAGVDLVDHGAPPPVGGGGPGCAGRGHRRHAVNRKSHDNARARTRQKVYRFATDFARAWAAAVDARTTGSGSKSSSSRGTSLPSTRAASRSTAARPMGSIGCRTVVSAGSVEFISAESSKPTTDTSPGQVSPTRRTARMAPRASGSL